jgi:microcystin-dependent protein
MDSFIGEIRIFAGNYAPAGWALCNGQLLPISQNTALFSILGTTYGGNGQTTFGLPNLQGAAPLMAGQGPGLSPRDLGESGGAQAVALTTNQMPAHSHTPTGSKNDGTDSAPTNAVWGKDSANRGQKLYAAKANKPLAMNPDALKPAGEGLPHNNLPPYLTLTFIIALQGIFPPRS